MCNHNRERLKLAEMPQGSPIVDNLVWGRFGIRRIISQPVIGRETKVRKER